MFQKIQRVIVAGLSSAILASGVFALSAPPAQAACSGVNARDQITVDTAEVKMDSCAANGLVNGYSDVKSATGLATLIGNKYPAVSFISAPFFAWAWANQSKVRNCAAGNTGVAFTEINGIVTGCSAQ